MKKIWIVCLCVLMMLSTVSCDIFTGGAKDGYVFKVDGVTIEIDAELDSVTDKLGDYIAYDEAPSCAGQGISKFYTYEGFEIESYEKNGVHCVYMIVLVSDTVKTAEGLSVGDSYDDVIEIYGEPESETARVLTYHAGDMYLKVLLKNGGKVVSSIQYVHPDGIEG